jgi:hypothetical protein
MPKTETHKLAPEIRALLEDSDLRQDWNMGPPSDPPNLRRKSRNRAVDLMVRWFLANFEDPVENTSRDSGEWVYIWGGPYNARQELAAAFGDEATEQALEEAAARIEEEGWEWAPSDSRMRPEEPYNDVARAKRRLFAVIENWATGHPNQYRFQPGEIDVPHQRLRIADARASPPPAINRTREIAAPL